MFRTSTSPIAWRAIYCLRAWFVVAIWIAVCAPGAWASPTAELEPNDSIFQMTGPISADGVTGTLASSDDSDRFLVQVRPQRQVKLSFVECSPSSSLDFELFTIDGKTSVSSNYGGNSSTPKPELLTTPGLVGGPSIALVMKIKGLGTGSGPCSYSFNVTNPTGGPTDAIDETPLPVFPASITGEPNDNESQAIGPLIGDTYYSGAIDRGGDVDWLKTPMIGSRTVSTELTATSEVDAEIRSYSSPQLALKASDSLVSGSFSVPFSGIYKIRISGYEGASWRLKISPATAVGPPPPSSSVRNRRVKRGRNIRVSVRNSVAKQLTYSLIRRGVTRRTGIKSIKGGRALIPTRRLKRGKYTLKYSITGIGERVVHLRIV